jgi:hypothetical protein
MINPEWIEAAADLAAAVEKGVAMRGNRKPVEAVAAAAAPTPVNVNISGITRDDFLIGMLILAGAVVVLAAAVLAHAAVVHHGLIA